MMAKRKLDSKTFAQQKRNRRKLLTFFRMLRYGVNNFSRNAWLTVAATAVMTITLLIIFTAITARTILSDTANQVRDRVDMSIYLKTDTTDAVGAQLIQEVSKLSSVNSASFVNAATARQQFAQKNSDSAGTLLALNEATNKLPATLLVKVKDINNTSQLNDFVKTDSLVKANLDPNRPPSFAGASRTAIESIGRAINFAQEVGLAAGLVFIAISSLIIFNTIRMAIFNRKEEIQMMKLIGADKSFIRGPFLVEAIVYGFVAAIVATGLGFLALYSSAQALLSYQIAVQPTIDFMTFYAGFVLLAMIIVGAIIGILSSLMATQRYLKIR